VGGGSNVNISSGAGVIGIPGQAAYAAFKWGFPGLTKAVALEVAGDDIRSTPSAPASSTSR
jgi:NAD(P)-dependent dehydrogenase (short-subunit alcohol dehydrogenase family)